MASSWEVLARGIHVNVLQKKAEALRWLERLLDLPFKLLNLEGLGLELAIEEEEVCQSLGEEIIPGLYLFSECLLVVSVHLNASNYGLLGDVEHGDDQGAFGSADDSKPVADILVFQVRLLAQEDIREGLLDVLEVKNDAIAFLKHFMDQVSFLRNQKLLVRL